MLLVAFGLALSSNLLTFIYYFFILDPNVKPTMLTTIQILTSASQYLFTYMCCQKSCRLLSSKEKWLTTLKLIGLVSFILQMCLLLYSTVADKLSSKNLYLSCTTVHWFLLNCSQLLIQFFFILVGVYLLKTVYEYKPTSELAI
jgi:hypothetical protein